LGSEGFKIIVYHLSIIIILKGFKLITQLM
jgi:hypothetical protein